MPRLSLSSLACGWVIYLCRVEPRCWRNPPRSPLPQTPGERGANCQLNGFAPRRLSTRRKDQLGQIGADIASRYILEIAQHNHRHRGIRVARNIC